MKLGTCRCFYCKRVLSHTRRRRHDAKWTSTRATKDHVIPRSNPLFPGDRGNVVLACARCNEARGDAPAILFLLFAKEELWESPRGTVREVALRYQVWLKVGCRCGRIKIAA